MEIERVVIQYGIVPEWWDDLSIFLKRSQIVLVPYYSSLHGVLYVAIRNVLKLCVHYIDFCSRAPRLPE